MWPCVVSIIDPTQFLYELVHAGRWSRWVEKGRNVVLTPLPTIHFAATSSMNPLFSFSFFDEYEYGFFFLREMGGSMDC
jgi:hypothetical protein